MNKYKPETKKKDMPILKKILHSRRKSEPFSPGQWTKDQIIDAIESKKFSTRELSPSDLIDQVGQASLLALQSNEIYSSSAHDNPGYQKTFLPVHHLPYSMPHSLSYPPPEKLNFGRQGVTPKKTTGFVMGTSREDKTLVQEIQTEEQNQQQEQIIRELPSADMIKELELIRQQLALFERERIDWKKKIKIYQAREDQMRKEIQENQNQINQLRQNFVSEETHTTAVMMEEQPSRHNSYQTVSTSSWTDDNYFDEMDDEDLQQQRQLSYPSYYSAYYAQQWRNYYNGYR